MLGQLLTTTGLAWLASGLLLRRTHPIGRLFTALIASWLLYSTWGYLLVEPLRTPRNVLAAAEEKVPESATFGLIRFKEQFILFADRDIVHFGFSTPVATQERNAWRWIAAGPERYLLIGQGLELDCFDTRRGTPLGTAHRNTWLLLGAESRAPDCPPPQREYHFHTPRPGRWLNAR